MNRGKLPLLVILGPTAVGKTKVAIHVAQQVSGEIISADSAQVYKGLDIGTDKPSLWERGEIAHHLLDVTPPDGSFNVADFVKHASNLISKITQRDKLPLIVGGTGLYMRALIYDFPLHDQVGSDPSLRRRLQAELEQDGADLLHQRLTEIDPLSANRIHPNDHVRLLRALEVYEQTGHTLSQFMQFTEKEPVYDVLRVGLSRDRSELYQRIEARVDHQLKIGLIGEVQRLLRSIPMESQSLSALGYKEVIAYLQHQYPYGEMVRILKQNTRRYAKRQLTWFRREPDVTWFNLSHLSERQVIETIHKIAHSRWPGMIPQPHREP